MYLLSFLKGNHTINGADTVLAIVRIITGLFMTFHGWEVFNSPKMTEYASWDSFKDMNGILLAYLGKGAELLGGLLLTFGLFTRLGSIIIIGTMSYIAFFIGNGKIWYEDQHPFMFVLIALIYLVMGAGKWSLDK
jgi:putative oxidoreductase